MICNSSVICCFKSYPVKIHHTEKMAPVPLATMRKSHVGSYLSGKVIPVTRVCLM